MTKIFIDGQSGTTGLQIKERLSGRTDLELLEIPYEERRNPAVKHRYLNEADLVILCLPDQAARESAAMVDNPGTKVLDASSAHRVAEGWTYGLPELDREQRDKIRAAQRVTNPGCYPTGFILGLRPLVAAGIMGADYPATVHAISGYSGGGKSLIQAHETHGHDASWAARPYRLQLHHKHLPEMQTYSGLAYQPIFNPTVGDFYNGIIVTLPIFSRLLQKPVTRADVHQLLSDYYAGETYIDIMPLEADTLLDNGFMPATACNGSNRLEMFVLGHDEQLLLVSRYDNLGKGASGAAVQNMNLMIGAEETQGTNLQALAEAVA